MQDLPKGVKRSLRRLAGIAHEREVRVCLLRLAESFAQWQAGTLDTWELTERIHRFHNGEARRLFIFYEQGRPELTVANALVSGVLQETECPSDVRAAIGNAIEFYRDAGNESPETSA
jgi:hypothetical protein